MLCTQLSRTFICRPFIGRCFVRLTTTDDKDVGRLGRSDPLERIQIYCAYSKTCSTIWLIMEQWVSNTDQQLTAYHMYPLNKRLEKIHIYPMRGYSVFWWSKQCILRKWIYRAALLTRSDSTQVLSPILRPCLNVDWLKFRAHQTAEKRERYDSFLSEIKNCDRS